jgi:hypothetical protein
VGWVGIGEDREGEWEGVREGGRDKKYAYHVMAPLSYLSSLPPFPSPTPHPRRWGRHWPPWSPRPWLALTRTMYKVCS